MIMSATYRHPFHVRQAIKRRYLAGEKAVVLALEYGVSLGYPSQLVNYDKYRSARLAKHEKTVRPAQGT